MPWEATSWWFQQWGGVGIDRTPVHNQKLCAMLHHLTRIFAVDPWVTLTIHTQTSFNDLICKLLFTLPVHCKLGHVSGQCVVLLLCCHLL